MTYQPLSSLLLTLCSSFFPFLLYHSYNLSHLSFILSFSSFYQSANAKIYELESKIEFVCADAYHILGSLATDDTHADTYCNTGVDIVLLAPPWGGPSYCLSKDFDMYTDFPSGNGLELVVEAAKVSKNIVCVFPRNIMISQVTEMAMAIDSPCRVEQVYLYGKHKLSVLYFGSLFCSV